MKSETYSIDSNPLKGTFKWEKDCNGVFIIENTKEGYLFKASVTDCSNNSTNNRVVFELLF